MYTNSLINETSPYLLQHAHNPVDWYAWNDETLSKAQSENKMLLISIGYAACHWCHVMEHESFEDEEVAKVMNENFICIKVDREERPDVDQVYMDAALLINGNGGWPLNALAMSDGKPFFAGTYYPKENWIQLLEYFAGIYKNEKNKLDEQAIQLSRGIAEMGKIPMNTTGIGLDKNDLEEMYRHFEKRIDTEKGGTTGSIKFPMPSVWEFLIQYSQLAQNEQALLAVETTLQNMAKGGIYDQVGGGFSRYATDSRWHVPHFEKMLYDNAQLVSLYSHAFQLTKKTLYKRIVYETLEFINRELLSPGGGFYSSLDADSEGQEGKFYVWAQKEIKGILKDDAELYIQYYGIDANGNWEHQKNIPDINFGSQELSKSLALTEESLQQKLKDLNNLLLKVREKRIRPGTDDKILTSWNALMAIGFIDAYRAFNEPMFLNSAKKNIDFLLANICNPDNSLNRNFKNGIASIPAFLDDYAFLISALTGFYQISFDKKYLLKADQLMKYCIGNFYDEESGMFFYTNRKYSNLIARKMETTDNVIPASNSEIAKVLNILSIYFENPDYETKSLNMVKNILEEVKKNVGYYSNWGIAILQHIHPPFEIAIVGEDWDIKLSALQKKYLPNALFMGGETEGVIPLLKDKMISGKTMIYVCRNKICKMPVAEATEALQLMN